MDADVLLMPPGREPEDEPGPLRALIVLVIVAAVLLVAMQAMLPRELPRERLPSRPKLRRPEPGEFHLYRRGSTEPLCIEYRAAEFQAFGEFKKCPRCMAIAAGMETEIETPLIPYTDGQPGEDQ